MLSMGVVLLCIVVLMCLFGFIDEAGDGSGEQSFLAIILTVLMDIPLQLSEVVPYVVFLGSVVGFGSLCASSEVTVLQTSGVSHWRLCVSVGLAAMVFLAAMTFVTEYVGPFTSRIAQDQERGEEVAGPRGGYWYREGQVFTRIRGIDENDSLRGVQQFEFDQQGNLFRATEATSGTPIRAAFAWELEDVNETLFDARSQSTSISAARTWNLTSDFPSFSSRLTQEPDDLSAGDLWNHIAYLKEQSLDSGQFEITFWSRLSTPLSVLGLVLIAVGFVLGPLRETGMGTRITAGIGAGIVFGYLQQTLAPLALLYNVPPFLAVLIPVSLMWVTGLVLVRRLS